MFTVYFDDSGTSPSQRVAVAAALVVPTQQIIRMESEWDTFKTKEGFSSFHTSEFIARNRRSDFAGWDTAKQLRVFKRVRQISKKYGLTALSFAVNKQDYEEVVSGDLRALLGKFHYTWAIRHLIAFVETWRLKRNNPPLEFVFDWMGKRSDERRNEVESAMQQAQYFTKERGLPGDFTHYSFHQEEIAGLQCVDAVAWVCYQYALNAFFKTPFQEFAEDAWRDFGGHLGSEGWLQAVTVLKANLEKWFALESNDGRTAKLFQKWQASQSQQER